LKSIEVKLRKWDVENNNWSKKIRLILSLKIKICKNTGHKNK